MVKRKILMMVFDRCPDHIDDIWYLIFGRYPDYIDDIYCKLACDKDEDDDDNGIMSMVMMMTMRMLSMLVMITMDMMMMSMMAMMAISWRQCSSNELVIGKAKAVLVVAQEEGSRNTEDDEDSILTFSFSIKEEKKKIWNWIKFRGNKRKDFPPKNLLMCPQTACLNRCIVRLVIIVFHIRTVSFQMSF